MNNLKPKHKLLVVLAGTIFLVLFITNTNPNNLSAGYLLVPPITVFLVLYVLSNFVLGYFPKLSSSKKNLMSVLMALGPMAILLLASMGQLTSRDTILSLLLMVGLTSYVFKARVKET